MKELLIRCYFDGMTLTEAIDFLTSACREAPTPRQIAAAKKRIMSFANVDWQ